MMSIVDTYSVDFGVVADWFGLLSSFTHVVFG